MRFYIWLVVCVCTRVSMSCAQEIDYNNCVSLHDVIMRETQELATTDSANHEELSQLYVARAESYLLDAQYEHAIEDFQSATIHSQQCQNIDIANGVAFRSAFGEVVSYDNLGMHGHTEQALASLHKLVDRVTCNDCLKHRPCQEIAMSSALVPAPQKIRTRMVNTIRNRPISYVFINNQDSYDDILGPNQSPAPNWCEEIVTGVGRAMDAIACLAPNHAVKIALIGVIEALITRGVKCCQAGGFWKACVAPITRKWKEWKNNKERSILPSARNLPLYVT